MIAGGREIVNEITRRKIRVNPDKSPLNLLRKKYLEKSEKDNFEERIENIRQVIARSEMISKNDGSEQRRNQLLKMMYQDDIDHEFVTTTMDISHDELESLVDELVQLGYLHYCSNDEVELTKDGVFHIISQDLDF